MAGRRGGGGKKKDPPAEETKAAKPSEVREVMSERKLKALLGQARSTAKDVSSLTGTMREKIAYASQNDHLHIGAFAVIKRLDRLEPEKLADFRDNFEHYFEVSGLAARAKQAQRLNFGPGKDEEEDEGDEDDGKVHRLHAAE